MKQIMLLAVCIGLMACSCTPHNKGDTPKEQTTFKQGHSNISVSGITNAVFAPESVVILQAVEAESNANAVSIVSTEFNAEIKNLSSTCKVNTGKYAESRPKSNNYDNCPYDHGLI